MTARRWSVCLAWLLVAGCVAGCPDEDNLLKRKRTASGDYITRVRGIKGLRAEPDLVGMPRPLGGGAVARLLIQPLDERLTRNTYVWALLVEQAETVRRVQAAVLAAPPAPFRTCLPSWRVDVRYGQHEHVVRLNLPCRRLQVDGRDFAYDDRVREALGPLIRRALRKPTHKIFRVRVPVEHDPLKILPVLASRAVEAYLPERPARRGPVARVTYTVQQRPPADPRQLDQAVSALRQRAYRKLEGYAAQLKIGRHEILEVLPPVPVYERFGDHVFEARYAVTVLFKHGTPEYMLGFLGLGNNLLVEKVTVPKDYRIDVVFAAPTRVSQMRKALTWVTVTPPLRRW